MSGNMDSFHQTVGSLGILPAAEDMYILIKVTKVATKRYTVRLHLYDIVEKAKLWRHKPDQWLSEKIWE